MRLLLSSLPGCLALVVALGLTTPVSVAAKGTFIIKPAATWVRKVVPAFDANLTAAPNSSSIKVLDDQQTKVGGSSVERYFHYVVKIESTAGLDDLSQLRFYFEPSYQQLAIHFVQIQRAGTIINALRPDEIKLVQKESELDQQLYNGSQEAVIFLNDLRVGDVVDYAYTVNGENPVLGGRFVDTLYLADSEPVQEMLVRLVIPSRRYLTIKNDNTDIQPTKQTTGDDTEYLWYVKNANAIGSDGSTPSWFNPYPRVTVSEFQSWGEVVNWALPLYPMKAPNSPELRSKVDEWKKADSPEQRTLLALRFIQDDIRYLGIELGRYSHQPTLPERVFARRFGDCKDKSFLLSTVLNAMGIDATPALVSTDSRAALDSTQPSPFAFDHVIVRARINGKTYWLDPTISYQRGDFDNYYDPPFERGLVIQAGVSDLEKIPVPASDSGTVDVVEVYSSATGLAPISLNVTTTYHGSEADQMRYELSTTSLVDLSKFYLNFYADTTPSISAEGLPAIEDDQKKNTLVVREQYRIDELWKDNKHRFIADKVYGALQKPRVSQRTTPLAINYPASLRQTILINLGRDYSFPEIDDVFTDDAIRFEYRYSRNGNQLRMDFSLKTFVDSISTDAIQNHLALLDKAQGVVGFELRQNGSAFAVSSDQAQPGTVAGVFLCLLLPATGIAVVLIVRRKSKQRRVSRFVPDLKARPGTSPETAFQVSSEGEVESLLRNYNCRCGKKPYDPELPLKRERFTYDGRRLFGLRLVCPACRQINDLYINDPCDNKPDGLANLSTS